MVHCKLGDLQHKRYSSCQYLAARNSCVLEAIITSFVEKYMGLMDHRPASEHYGVNIQTGRKKFGGEVDMAVSRTVTPLPPINH